MEIRSARESDLPEILRIYAAARSFMIKSGNPTQWGDSYPPESLILEDIAQGRSFVLTENSGVVGVFVFATGDDPTYSIIEKGRWRREEPYGVIHRVASDGTVRGLASALFAWCKGQVNYLRVDTHQENRPMQHALLQNGFQFCGIIHVADGTERLAYDWYPEP